MAQKSKTAAETSKFLDKIFQVRAPKKFLTDKGGEFLGACKVVYSKYSIHHYTTNDVTQKVAPVERAILVVKQRLFKMMAVDKNFVWTDKLEPIIKAYNKSYNRNLGMDPHCAEKPKNRAKVFHNSILKRINKRPINPKFQFNVGQVVRILKDQTHGKSYTGNYSNMLYKIVKRDLKSRIPVYYLRELLTDEEIKGIFYTAELKPVNIDEAKLPEVEAIHGIRLDNEEEQVQVSFKTEPKKRQWVMYDNLIPYSL